MKNEVVEHKVKLKDLVKGSDGELIRIQDWNATKVGLETIALDYKDYKVDNDNISEAKEIRAEIRESRFGLQNISEHNNSLINRAKKENKDQLEEMIAIIRPIEDRIHEQIKFVEDEKKRIKAEKEQIERKRVDDIRNCLNDWKVSLSTSYAIGHESQENFEDFQTKIEFLKQAKFEEFQFEGDSLLFEYEAKLDPLRKLMVEKIEREKKRIEELAELKKKEEENIKLKAELDQLRKEQKEQLAKIKQETEKVSPEKQELELAKKDLIQELEEGKKELIKQQGIHKQPSEVLDITRELASPVLETLHSKITDIERMLFESEKTEFIDEKFEKFTIALWDQFGELKNVLLNKTN